MIGTMTLTHEISGRMTSSSFFPFAWKGWPGFSGPHGEQNTGNKAASLLRYTFPVDRGNSTSQSTEVFSSHWETVFTPRTDLGKKLYALRTKAVIAGMKLLSEEEVLEEVKRRRGEIDENEKNLY